MPRRIPVQVTQTVSRLLEGGYVKKPPAWYEPTLRHPPALVPPRQSRQRPDSDLPRALQREAREALAHHERPHMNSRKKLRSQMPPLRPQPIVYDADRIRRQFFRDHPWEAKRATTLVEMDYELEANPEPQIPMGEMPELTHWSRLNPSVEEYVLLTHAVSSNALCAPARTAICRSLRPTAAQSRPTMRSRPSVSIASAMQTTKRAVSVQTSAGQRPRAVSKRSSANWTSGPASHARMPHRCRMIRLRRPGRLHARSASIPRLRAAMPI